ncbi:transcription initiation factor TFIID subunit 12 [Bacillus rossius redtenbacheri]|uniref:transcription initiation factor TFIID subunit 12 n=1 Tax=Bacillus rossius redtenbacheri TaxID=93214 RepID=UPI002FDE05CA
MASLLGDVFSHSARTASPRLPTWNSPKVMMSSSLSDLDHSQNTVSSVMEEEPLSHQADTSATEDASPSTGPILSKNRLHELVKEVDPSIQLDEEVEDILIQIADDFLDSTIKSACLFSKHRNATTLEVKDVQLHLERHWNMWIPGFDTREFVQHKKVSSTEAHKQRMALIRKATKR